MPDIFPKNQQIFKVNHQWSLLIEKHLTGTELSEENEHLSPSMALYIKKEDKIKTIKNS